VESRPAADLRARVLRCLAELPQAGVGPPPDLAEQVAHVGQPLAGGRRQQVAAAGVVPDGLHQVAEAAELELAAGLVADVGGSRVPVAGHRRLVLCAQHLAGQRVDGVHARVGVARGLQQPAERVARGLLDPDRQQRVEREGQVAHPGVAVVVVALAAQHLGQRGGRRRRDRAGARVAEKQQRQQAALDRLAPGSLVAVAGDHRPPCLAGRGQISFGAGPRGEGERLVLGQLQHEQSSLARRERHARLGDGALNRGLARAPALERELQAPAPAQHEVPLAPQLEAAGGGAGCEAPPERDLAGEALDAADQLGVATRAPVADRDRIADPDAALAGGEGRLEHVRAGRVAALESELALGSERHPPTPAGVQQRVEDRLGVDVRSAHPVDRAVAADQARRPSVTDHAVSADRQVPVHPLDPHALPRGRRALAHISRHRSSPTRAFVPTHPRRQRPDTGPAGARSGG